VNLGLGLELTKLKMKTTLLRIESCDTNRIERGLERLSDTLGNVRVLISGFRTFQLVPTPSGTDGIISVALVASTSTSATTGHGGTITSREEQLVARI
jgi:hypothetical protein